MTRQVSTLSAVRIRAPRLRKAFFILDSSQNTSHWDGGHSHYCQWISRLLCWKIIRTTYWQCDWPLKAHCLYPIECACAIEWHSTSVSHLQIGWAQAQGADMSLKEILGRWIQTLLLGFKLLLVRHLSMSEQTVQFSYVFYFFLSPLFFSLMAAPSYSVWVFLLWLKGQWYSGLYGISP